ncbi:cardiotrophin-1-like [Protobothrops mucrosquamatus]|uniref:cardiotrophin-1-like n=1 Tax=Protobothrops mucrosquamatus TaxID=103944 RepID=UPI00077595A7|nr:cardiotrophin-1-like [Protobothrops mucrosquamatus]
MEVLSVDLQMCSGCSHTQQEIAVEIERTHNLTLSMQFSSGQLLSSYVHHQGMPFGDPDFNPLIQPFPGVPLPTLSTTDWLGLTDQERLQQNASAFSNLPVYLASVKCQQMDLNPLETELHRQLESSSLRCLGLENNLKSIMSSLDIAPGPAVSAQPLEPDNAFLAKLTGYYVCHLFRDWVNRCEKDIALLTKKYPV